MRLFIVSVVAVLLALSCRFGMSEVVSKFDTCRKFFFEGQPPVIPDILNPNSEHVRYKKICQTYSSQKNDKIYTFATLYDTESRIPVFSAYKYTGKGNFTRPEIPWMIEPQLDPPDGNMIVPYRNQAIDEDYFKNNYQVNRGHLFPSGHAADEFTAESTFTLTNIVPQNISFNAGSWNRIENKTRDSMNTDCSDDNGNISAFVLTGAIPGKNRLNNRVNIPSYMWTTFCCRYNSRKITWVSQAYWGINKEENEDEPIRQKSLQELQKFLSEKYKYNVQLFKNNCKKQK
ncbi:Endonuclease domain-containing 1 protein [Labeo rohita]|uniref:Endonuclease domain-containing 1 protein n=1 Tax=Labeo rohita TaxID=84645 RepID=A0ABQ8LDL7_LABRO|nr:endonuclease domain-containing 1 protein [Labeo rohita]KAI2647758.1 Endonuclease domain-containing 1 protein [Labeo rohita]